MTTTSAAAPRLIGHRGAPHDAPEHTIPAYEAALRAGADALALDVRLSADDQLVVIHDARLERTTDGGGAVRDRTAQELKRLDAGGWFSPGFRGQRIQTLPEVVERFRDQMGFLVRLPADTDPSPGIEERLVTLLQIYGVIDRTLVLSPARDALARCRDLDPDVRTGLLVAEWVPDPAALASGGGLGAVCLPAAVTAAGDVGAAREAGLDCYVGVVNNAAAALRFAAWGVTGIVTERADLLRRALRGAS